MEYGIFDKIDTGAVADDVLTYNGTKWVPQAPAGGALTSAFHAYLTLQDNIGSGNTKVDFDQERFDIGGDFDITTQTFTAPVTGYYFLSTELNFRDVNNTCTGIEIIFTFSGVLNNTSINNPNDAFASATLSDWHFSHSGLFLMSAGHTCAIHVNIGVSTILDILAGTNQSTFCGYLVGT